MPDNIDGPIYDSKLKNWDLQASVRVKSRRILIDEEASGKLYFPPELAPVTQHTLVRSFEAWALRELLIQCLYHYLDFTTMLEHDVVNRVAQLIAQRKIGVALPPQMLLDAYKIYTDEAYHAYFSADLKLQIEYTTGIVPKSVESSRCLRRLQELLFSIPHDLRQIAEVFFTIVSETLISGILCQIPKDDRVVSTIRLLVADHAEDEGRHHAYFSKLLEFLWPQLDQKQKSIIGPLLVQFIFAFLEPDYDAVVCELSISDLKFDEVQQIMAETYSPSAILSEVQRGAKATLRLFERNGIFEDELTRIAFLQSGLLL
ncbi:MAG TPA: diiron oxygenase [Ktedonobacteraceae bacterium]|nr:diiron oxygenase [Ktedonobacteraceae bacterium]